MRHTNDKQKLKEYKLWLEGQSDRINGRPCYSANGIYLDGFYAPDREYPDFLTESEVKRFKALL